MRPVICMITAEAQHENGDDAQLLERIGAAARAGVHLIQVRQPAIDARPLKGLVEGAMRAVGGSGARVIVNERLDVALAAGAHGVHLRGDSMPAARVRAIAPPGFLIGRSIHSVDEAADASSTDNLDYVIFGTVFPTSSKPGGSIAGIDGLRAACAATALPVLAVGGMRLERLGEVAAAGAAGLAAIGFFADGPLEALPGLIPNAARAFDTPLRVP
jgi:thiamine-phosphate pyrophosphorylase